MKFKNSFHPYATVTIFFWSLSHVFTRLALQHFSAFALGFWRYAIASLLLLGVAFLFKTGLPRKADIKWFLLAGAAGFFLYTIFFNKGFETITPATSSVIIATAPILTALLARLVYREKLAPSQWGSIFLGFAGVLTLTLMGGALSVNIGVIWMLLAAFSISVYNLLQRRLTKTYTGLQASIFSIFGGTLLLCSFLPTGIQQAKTALPIYWFYVAVLGVFSSAVAYVAWAIAFTKAKQASSVSNYMFATPFVTSLLSFVISGEAPSLSTLVGGAI
ncbi:MAG: DMT family transporter, partial [Oscillospiraceae bacterium]